LLDDNFDSLRLTAGFNCALLLYCMDATYRPVQPPDACTSCRLLLIQ
jgi:hypothetical protein